MPPISYQLPTQSNFSSQGRKTSYDAVSNYIGYIEDAFLFISVTVITLKEKILCQNAKYYINDLAYKNYLYPGCSCSYGYLAENLVYLELKEPGIMFMSDLSEIKRSIHRSKQIARYTYKAPICLQMKLRSKGNILHSKLLTIILKSRNFS